MVICIVHLVRSHQDVDYCALGVPSTLCTTINTHKITTNTFKQEENDSNHQGSNLLGHSAGKRTREKIKSEQLKISFYEKFSCNHGKLEPLGS